MTINRRIYFYCQLKYLSHMTSVLYISFLFYWYASISKNCVLELSLL